MLIAVKFGKIFKNRVGEVCMNIDMTYSKYNCDEVKNKLEALKKFSLQDGASFVVTYEEGIRGLFHKKFGDYFDLIVE